MSDSPGAPSALRRYVRSGSAAAARAVAADGLVRRSRTGLSRIGSMRRRRCWTTGSTRPRRSHRAAPRRRTWTYRRLLDTANRIAHVLVEDLGLVPGGRVLLRARQSPDARCLLVRRAQGRRRGRDHHAAAAGARAHRHHRPGARCTMALTDARGRRGSRSRHARPRRGAARASFNSTALDGLEARIAARSPSSPTWRPRPTIPRSSRSRQARPAAAKATVHVPSRPAGGRRYLRALHAAAGRPTTSSSARRRWRSLTRWAGWCCFPMRFGASTALIEQASPPQLLEGIQKFRATITITSPTAYRAMLRTCRRVRPDQPAQMRVGGRDAARGDVRRWEEATGIRLMDGIGSTEMLHMFIGSCRERRRPGSTGTVVPGYRADVVDEHGHEVPAGTIGRLAVAGPTGCRYLDDLANQQQYVQHGWNLTGDAYWQDADGYFWYQSRDRRHDRHVGLQHRPAPRWRTCC